MSEQARAFMVNISTITRQGIDALRYTPVNPRGLVIWYHGWSSKMAGQELRALAFANAGWEVIVPAAIYHDNRGEIDYEDPKSYPLFWKTLFQNVRESDIWMDYARENGYKLIVSSGHSMGGFSALGVAAQQKAVSGVVAINGSGHWPLSHLFFQARFGQMYPLAAEINKAVEEMSPHMHAQALKKKPFYLIHGAADNSVDPRADVEFATILQDAGADVKTEFIDDLGHFVTTGMLVSATDWLGKRFLYTGKTEEQ